MLISSAAVDSWAPSITLSGATVVISYRTPTGPVTRNYTKARLVESAAGLMDNPIPPLDVPPASPPGGSLPGGGGGPIHKN
jgi:hypothetical protein